MSLSYDRDCMSSISQFFEFHAPKKTVLPYIDIVYFSMYFPFTSPRVSSRSRWGKAYFSLAIRTMIIIGWIWFFALSNELKVSSCFVSLVNRPNDWIWFWHYDSASYVRLVKELCTHGRVSFVEIFGSIFTSVKLLHNMPVFFVRWN